MPDKTPEQAQADFDGFLGDAKHQKRSKPDKPDAVEAHAERNDPDWRKQGKDAPPGWKVVGDTFEED